MTRAQNWLTIAVVLFAALSSLWGCAGPALPPPEPKVVVQVVKIPAPVSCIPDSLGPAQVYVDTDSALKGADGPTQFQLMAAEHARRAVRLEELEAIVKGCRLPAGYKPPASAPSPGPG